MNKFFASAIGGLLAMTLGDRLSRDQIERRMAIIAPHFKWIRAFSVTEGNELIPLVAKEMGLNTLVGAWLGADSAKNREEIDTLAALAHEGVVDVAAVGNEVLYRDELSEDELLDYMADARARLPASVPMGYVDAYYEFEDRPRVTDACDVILSNCYPFWEGCAHPLRHFVYAGHVPAATTSGARPAHHHYRDGLAQRWRAFLWCRILATGSLSLFP